jgi:hypothetical protein
MKWHYALGLGLLWSTAQPARSGPAYLAFWLEARTGEGEIPCGGGGAWPADSGWPMASYRERCCPRPFQSQGKHTLGVGWMETSPEKAVDGGARRRKGNGGGEGRHGSPVVKERSVSGGAVMRCSRAHRLDRGTTESGRWWWCSWRKAVVWWTCLPRIDGRWLELQPSAGERGDNDEFFPSAWMASRERVGGRRWQEEIAVRERKQGQSRASDEHEEVKWNEVCSGDTNA